MLKPSNPIAASYKILTAKRIAERSAEAVPATAGSYANQTYKPDAALKPAVVAANVGLSETETCKLHVARVQIERILQTLVALQANAGLFRTRISKLIAELQAEGEVANADLYASQIYRPCAVRRQAVDLANVDLYGIAICRRLVGRLPNNF